MIYATFIFILWRRSLKVRSQTVQRLAGGGTCSAKSAGLSSTEVACSLSTVSSLTRRRRFMKGKKTYEQQIHNQVPADPVRTSDHRCSFPRHSTALSPPRQSPADILSPGRRIEFPCLVVGGALHGHGRGAQVLLARGHRVHLDAGGERVVGLLHAQEWHHETLLANLQNRGTSFSEHS